MSSMHSRAIVRQLVEDLMRVYANNDELRKRMLKILRPGKYKDEDDDDPE